LSHFIIFLETVKKYDIKLNIYILICKFIF
jgi:hypothetical protein